MPTITAPSGALTSACDFRATLEAELADVDRDNPVAAVRVVARVARRFHAEAPTSWEAARWSAEELVRSYFEARDMDPTKAAVWAVCDPYFGNLERDSDTPTEVAQGTKGARTTRTVSVAVAGGAP